MDAEPTTLSSECTDKAHGHMEKLSEREAHALDALMVRSYTYVYQLLLIELLIPLQSISMSSTPMIEQSEQYQDRLKRGNGLEGFVFSSI